MASNSWPLVVAWCLFVAAGDAIGVRWWRDPSRVGADWARLRGSPESADPRRIPAGIVAGNFMSLGLVANAIRVSYGVDGPQGIARGVLIAAGGVGLVGTVAFVVISFVVARTGRPHWLVPPAMRERDALVENVA